MKKIVYIATLLLSALAFGQVGINTSNPLQMFHTDGQKNTPATGVTGQQQKDDFVVTKDGNVGAGWATPAVRLDLRSASPDDALAIGYTTKTATAAGKGAIRYDDTSGGKLQVSNGVVWQDIISTPQKAEVVARINAGNNTIKVPYNAPTIIAGWQETSDATSNFDNTTGVFTAPRDGVYTVSFTFNFVEGSFNANSYVESQIMRGNTLAVKCLKTWGKATRNAQAGGTCVTSIGLNEGEKLSVRLLQTIDNNARGLRSSTAVTNPFFGFNNLTIVEN